MVDHIRNNLQHVSIGGNYVGGHQTVHHPHGSNTSPEKENIPEPQNTATVFLSYCQKNSETADQIDRRLTDSGIIVKRDIRDIPHWTSIRTFMQSIRDQDVAVLLVSDEYLKSHACMFEVMEIMKERQYRDRILPIVIEPGIYDKSKCIEYIAHWQQEAEQYETAMQPIKPENQSGMPEELKQMKQIAASMGEFLQIVADKNNPAISDAGDAIIAIIRQRNILEQ